VRVAHRDGPRALVRFGGARELYLWCRSTLVEGILGPSPRAGA
jgi:hypothetical protein